LIKLVDYVIEEFFSFEDT